MNTSLNNKKLYKVSLLLLKFLPIIMSLSYLANVICARLGIGLQIITHYLGLVIAPIAFMYISSYLFRFCNYHRIFIHYIAVVELINITDWYWHIPISNEAICRVHFIITTIFLCTAVIMYINKYNCKKYLK